MSDPTIPPLAPRASSSALWSSVDLWLQQITQLLIFVLVGNVLGPDVVGVNTMAVVTVLFFAMFIEGGLTDALIQREELEQDHIDSALWLMVALGIMEALIVWIASPLIADFYLQPELKQILPLMAISLPFIGIAACYGAVLQRQLKFKQLATRSIVAYSVAFLAAVVMAHTGYGVYSLVTFFVLSRILDAVLILIVSGRRPRLVIEKAALRQIVDYGKHRVVHRVINYVGTQLDRIAIGYFLGPHELGVYAIAERLIAALVNGFTGVLYRVAFPMLAAYQGDRPRFDMAVRDFLTAANIVAFPIFAGLAITSTPFVQAMFKPVWDGLAPIMMILCLLGFLQPSFLIFTAATNAIGRPKIVVAQGFITLGLKILCIPIAAKIGVIPVVCTTVSLGYVMLLIYMYLLRELFGARWGFYYSQSSRPALATLAMVVAVWFLNRAIGTWDSLPTLIVEVLAGILAYVAALRILAPELFGRALLVVTRRA